MSSCWIDSLHSLKVAVKAELFKAILIFLAIISLQPLGAQELPRSGEGASLKQSEITTRLSRINTDVLSTERVIAQLKAEYARLKGEERDLEGAIRKLSDEEQGLLDKSTEALRRKERLVLELRDAEKRLHIEQSLVRERLRGLYMNAVSGERALALVGGAKGGDIERTAVYVSAVKRYDAVKFTRVKQAVQDLVSARQAVERVIEEGKILQVGIQSKRSELESKTAKLRGVINDLQTKQASAKRSLESLQSEAEKLELLMRTIMSQDLSSDDVISGDERGIEATPSAPAIATVGGGGVKPATAPPKSVASVMHPGGLFANSAKLVRPVVGAVVQRFGKNKVTSFSDMVFSKGLEFRAEQGSEVKAVLGGRVAFSGSMPGFDTVVIVDHGERSYTLYGRLSKSHVKVGQLVEQREALGVTAAPDSKGRNFYFETRKNGSPVDPATLLRPERLVL